MGKTRTKLIDDSIKESLESKVKSQEKKAPKKEQDSLVAKLQQELGIIPEKPQADTSEVESNEDVILGSEATPESKKEDSGQVLRSRGPHDRGARMTKSIKPQKPGKAKSRSKKYLEVSKDLDRSKSYPLPEALDIVKKMSYPKFNDVPGTLEVHVNTAQTGIRGLVSLPFASGKKIRILAFGTGAKDSGADILGSDESIEEINKGKINFDLVITTPEWMSKLAKAAKILGPKGLMPNPKNGTIVSGEAGLKKAVEGFQAGKTEYRTEAKAPLIHLGLGKLNQPNEELEANIKILLQTIGKTRVKKVTLSPTMGPGVKLDLASI